MANYDLTTSGSSATINGAIFDSGLSLSSTGTGTYDTFLMIQVNGNGTVESGFNTDINPLPLDDKQQEHTNAIVASQIPLVTINGVEYLEIRLDINENENLGITLTDFKVYAGGNGSPADLSQAGALIYDLDGAGDSTVQMTDFKNGSGKSDYVIYIPKGNVQSTDYITVYGKFTNVDAGFEEFGTAPASGWANPKIAIDKMTMDGTASGDSLHINTGEAITWQYAVTNAGNVALSNVTVSDSDSSVHPTYVSGDTNNDGKLDLTETWIFKATGAAGTDGYTNTGTASGKYTDGAGTTTVTANDGSGYTGDNPQISIDKVTIDGSASGDDLSINAGEAITWQYTVTNSGNVALSNITVSDSDGSVHPGYVSGDANSNGKLDLGETWIFTGTGTAGTDTYTNTGTASGSSTDSAGHTATDTATDGSGYFGANPQIAIDKVTVDGSVSGDDLTVAAGDAITWRYTVTNAGNVALDHVTVGDSDAGVSPVYVSGDADSDGKLDLTESWVFEATGTAQEDQYSNTGTASGDYKDTAGHTKGDTATDDSGYFGAVGGIAIDKVTVDGSASGDTLKINAGEAITWQYTVTNAGNIALHDVSVTDSDSSVSPVYVSGDTNTDGNLDVGETWIFEAGGTAGIGPYSNTGHAEGIWTDSLDVDHTKEADDDSGYTGANPQIAIDKVTVDGSASGDDLSINAGEAITWQYTVTNAGNVALDHVTVSDSDGSLTPTYVSGDADSDGKLDLGESWVYEATGTAGIGDYSNTGTASGDYKDTAGHTLGDSATDDSGYTGANPQIAINKVTVDGSASGDSLKINAGEAITWRYTVTNAGNVALDHVTVSDSDGSLSPAYVSGDADSDGKLDLGESWVYEATGTAGIGSYSNTGTASGDYKDTAGHTSSDTATDNSGYFGANPQIAINKVTVDGSASGDSLKINAGETISWKYTVKNAGNVALCNVSVTDSDSSVSPAYVSGDTNSNGKLDLAETWIYSATGTAGIGSYTNTGTASGTYKDSAGHKATDTASDGSGYCGTNPQIAINKVTVDGSASGDNLTINKGEAINWKYTVTNVGNVALSNVTVSDSDSSVHPTYVSGDNNSNGKLDLAETWIYSASGTAGIGPYSNTGTASGSYKDSAGHTATDTESDNSGYTGANASLDIQKLTNGTDDANLMAGSSVTWTYTVTNNGNVPVTLSKTAGLVDDNGTVGTGDDFKPTYLSGDTNNDGKVDAGEAWQFKATGTAGVGPYTNTATVTGSFSDTAGHKVYPTDSDTSHYDGFSDHALSQGFWTTHQGLWNGNNETLEKSDQAVVKSGVVTLQPGLTNATNDILYGETKTVDGVKYFLLGDANSDGVANDTNDLYISVPLAQSIFNTASTGDTRIIMLNQAIAAQLNIDNGTPQPNNLISEAVDWLTGKGSWAGLGVNVDANNDGVMDQTVTSGKYALGGSSVSTSGPAWQTMVDVVAGSPSWEWDSNGSLAGNQQVSGEGLKNALEAFNLDKLVASGSGLGSEVGWNNGSSVINVHDNTPDQFWQTLHQTGGLTGIS